MQSENIFSVYHQQIEMKKHLLAFVVFLATAVVITRPLIFHLTSAIIDPTDGLLLTWIMNWNIHVISGGPLAWINFSNANIFFPYSHTLAFSDYHLPGSILALPFVLFFGQPLLAFNINFLLGFALTGFGLYLLILHITKNNQAAFLAGFVGTFSLLHLNYAPHLQLLNLWPVFLATLFLLRKQYWRYIFFFVASVTTTPLFLYFLLLITSVFLIAEKVDHKRRIKALFIALILNSLFLIPFWLVSREFHYTRPITDAINFSLNWQDLFTVGSMSKLSILFPTIPDTTPGFLGVTMTFLIGFFLIQRFILKKLEEENGQIIIAFSIIGFVAFILSFGPVFHIFRHTAHVGPLPGIPMPYLIFYYLLPGFAGFRTASRWLILAGFSFLIAVVVYFSKRITFGWVIVFCVITFWEIRTPMMLFAVPSRQEFPQAQVWLKNNFVGDPIIEFPINAWFNQPGVQKETLKMYYSTIHWHPMFNGYSGFSPTEWENRVKYLQKEFPSSDSLALLAKLKLKLILVPSPWKARISAFSEVKLIKEFPDTAIYQIN